MKQLIYVTHGDVIIDPEVPVTDWGLTERGRQRHLEFANGLKNIGAIHCSTEQKAREAASITGAVLGLVPAEHENLGENDRSATGYLEKDAFEAMADAFFANPNQSVRGWERAVDAQARIVNAVQRILAEDRSEGDVLIFAHGGVGALLRAFVTDQPIDRSHDQPVGKGGYVLKFSVPQLGLNQDWVNMDASGASFG